MIAFLHPIVGPYVAARLSALRCRASVVAIEGSRRSSVYAWKPTQHSPKYGLITLFPGCTTEKFRPADVRRKVTKALADVTPDAVIVPG